MLVAGGHLDGYRKVSVRSRDLGPLGDEEVLVQTHMASICDADLFCYLHGTPTDYPSFEWLGHEGGGTVVKVGAKVLEFAEGDRVMLFGPWASFAPFFKAPVRSLHKAPAGLAPDLASLAEPTCVGLYGVFQSGVQPGDTVAVVGLNYQGLLAVQGLKLKGAHRVIAVDYNEAHLALAKKLGADILLNTTREEARKAIWDLTEGQGLDVAFHSCGYWNPRGEEYVQLCVDTVRTDGVMLTIPDPLLKWDVLWHRIHHYGIDLRFAALMHKGHEFRHHWVPKLLKPVQSGQIDVRSLITARYKMEEMPAAMADFETNLDHVKIILEP